MILINVFQDNKKKTDIRTIKKTYTTYVSHGVININSLMRDINVL